MKEHCGNCKHYRDYQCHQDSPSLSLGLPAWPPTLSTQWCGQWEKAPKKKKEFWGPPPYPSSFIATLPPDLLRTDADIRADVKRRQGEQAKAAVQHKLSKVDELLKEIRALIGIGGDSED